MDDKKILEQLVEIIKKKKENATLDYENTSKLSVKSNVLSGEISAYVDVLAVIDMLRGK